MNFVKYCEDQGKGLDQNIMKRAMVKNIYLASMLVLMLAACSPKKSNEAAQSNEPELPSFTMDQMLDFNQAQREELKRRCLGATSQTCNDYKSETFKKRDELAKTFCDMAEVQRMSRGADKALPRSVKCNVYY